jgi:hypothetical protein
VIYICPLAELVSLASTPDCIPQLPVFQRLRMHEIYDCYEKDMAYRDEIYNRYPGQPMKMTDLLEIKVLNENFADIYSKIVFCEPAVPEAVKIMEALKVKCLGVAEQSTSTGHALRNVNLHQNINPKIIPGALRAPDPLSVKMTVTSTALNAAGAILLTHA